MADNDQSLNKLLSIIWEKTINELVELLLISNVPSDVKIYREVNLSPFDFVNLILI